MGKAFSRRSVRLLLLAGVTLGVTAGVAVATIPDGGGVYTACMLKATGTIRLIDLLAPSNSLLSHCTQLEKQITWNEKGRPGPAGPRPEGRHG